MTDARGPHSFTFILVGDATSPKNVADFSNRLEGLEVQSEVIVTDPNSPLANGVNGILDKVSGDFICIVDAEGILDPEFGFHFSRYQAAHPECNVIYGDESQTDPLGRVSTVAKPAFSPERLRCQFYLGTPVFYRRESLIELGGLSATCPGAELYELALRASRAGVVIGHVHEVLFLGSGIALTGPQGDAALRSTRSVLEEHMNATGDGLVRSVNSSGIHDTRRSVQGNPLVSIIIPTRGVYQEVDGRTKCFVVDAVRSIIEKSTYRNIEIVVVIDSIADQAAIAELNAIAQARMALVTWERPFNFSEKVNHGVLHSSGDYILILNDDVEVISPDWIEALLALGQLDGAGMVGGMLYYADDTIQHAGHAYWDGDASHIGLDEPRGDSGPLGGYLVEREVVGVTAACALMPRDVFLSVGGLSHLLPGNFNDVDLCMKTTWRGFQIYWTPHAELYHFESKTRDATVHDFEVDVTWARWSFRMNDIRYWPYPLSRPPR